MRRAAGPSQLPGANTKVENSRNEERGPVWCVSVRLRVRTSDEPGDGYGTVGRVYGAAACARYSRSGPPVAVPARNPPFLDSERTSGQ